MVKSHKNNSKAAPNSPGLSFFYSKIQLTRYSIPKSEFSKMSSRQKRQFVMVVRMLQEVNWLQKYLIYSINDKSTDIVYKHANTAQSLFLLRNLISVQYEIRKFYKKEIKNVSGFSSELKKLCKEYGLYFDGQDLGNLFAFVRDKFGFHYETQKDIEPLIEKVITSKDQLEMWLADGSGNDVYDFCEKSIMEVVYQEMIRLKIKLLHPTYFEELLDLTLKVTRASRDLMGSFLVEEILKSVNFNQDVSIDVEVPLLDSIRLPALSKRGDNGNSSEKR